MRGSHSFDTCKLKYVSTSLMSLLTLLLSSSPKSAAMIEFDVKDVMLVVVFWEFLVRFKGSDSSANFSSE